MSSQVCAKVMLPEPLKKSYRRKFLNPELMYLTKKNLRAAVLKKAKTCTKCPSCEALNGIVKKSSAGILKIIHDKYRTKKPTDAVVKNVLKEFHEAKEANKEVATMINSGLVIEMSPLEVRTFRRLQSFYSEVHLHFNFLVKLQIRPHSRVIPV